jgi:hypothetical protein
LLEPYQEAVFVCRIALGVVETQPMTGVGLEQPLKKAALTVDTKEVFLAL